MGVVPPLRDVKGLSPAPSELQDLQEFLDSKVRLPDNCSERACGYVSWMDGNRYGTPNIGFVQEGVATFLPLENETSSLKGGNYFSWSQNR